jgi:heme/copper-type cytochrome/quinol oxidase subunit 2
VAKIPYHWRGIILAAFGLLVLLVPAPASSKTPVERTIRVEASSFEYSPAVVKVNPGDHVTLELVSTDVVHGIYLDGYNLEVTADPGQAKKLIFTADKPGTFRFRCSVTCGPLHPFMAGKLQVGQNWLMWRATGLAILGVFAGLLLTRKRAS